LPPQFTDPSVFRLNKNGAGVVALVVAMLETFALVVTWRAQVSSPSSSPAEPHGTLMATALAKQATTPSVRNMALENADEGEIACRIVS